MRVLKRNEQTFQYRLYVGEEETIDDNGDYTGVYVTTYSSPVTMRASISPASGYSQTEQFGTLEGYDKVIVTGDMSCPIDEHSVINIENIISTDDAPYDYIVKKVAKSLNYISIAITKVVVS